MQQIRHFEPNQVVFIKDKQGLLRPAKITIMSSYGTYKAKAYASKDEEYVSEYDIEEYSEEVAEGLAFQNKKNKKLAKFLKMAGKDHENFLGKVIEIKQVAKFCKEEEEEVEVEIVSQRQVSVANSKYLAVTNIKSQFLVDSLKQCNEITFSYLENGVERTQTQKIKSLIMMKLIWALDDITLEISNGATQNSLAELIESEVIEPVEYITTCLHSKIQDAIEQLKKSKKTKLKNYLMSRENAIMLGVQNYMKNYSLLLRISQKISKHEEDIETRDDFNELNQAFEDSIME